MLDRAAGCLFGMAIGGDLGPETELALIVARALVGLADYDGDAIDEAVTEWTAGGGQITRASPLVRAIGIGIWAHDPDKAVAAARRDRRQAPANAALAGAIAIGMQGGTPDAMLRLLGDAGISLPEPGATTWTSAVSGALAGAAYGRSVFPVPQVMRVLTWRPDSGLGVARPRPEICWTDDLVDLAEALLRQGQRSV
jgi:hypothetical protein